MSIKTSWERSLPDCGYNLTSTLVSGTNVYAACNGYVYLLDFETGEVRHQNPLSGYGHNEVRLAISDDGSTLLVGTDGYVLGLNPSTLAKKWESDLKGSGYNIVNVLAEGTGGIGYAACNGYVYRYTISDGDVKLRNPLSGYGGHETRLALTLKGDMLLILHQNNLDDTGEGETRIALRDDGGVLFVGVNGYGLAVKASDISTLYTRSCGYNITDIVSGNLFTYFGCNGYVYSLDEGGNVVCTNGLPGLGKYETRLAIDTETKEHVFVGIDGYAVSL
ncbi:hypothetical protein DL93DRAFT_2039103, partial [Clavulina sp. PMI_390]